MGNPNTPKNPAAQALGRLGAASRNRKLSPERRREIASKAGQAFKANCAQRRAVRCVFISDYPNSPNCYQCGKPQSEHK